MDSNPWKEGNVTVIIIEVGGGNVCMEFLGRSKAFSDSKPLSKCLWNKLWFVIEKDGEKRKTEEIAIQ